VKLVTGKNSVYADYSETGVTTAIENDTTPEKDATAVIGTSLLSRPEAMQKARASIKEFGFIISRESASTSVEVGSDLSILADYVVLNERLIMLRKVSK